MTSRATQQDFAQMMRRHAGVVIGKMQDKGIDSLTDREASLLNSLFIVEEQERIEHEEHLVLFKIEGRKAFGFGMMIGGILVGAFLKYVA